jgi:hypothetical protein
MGEFFLKKLARAGIDKEIAALEAEKSMLDKITEAELEKAVKKRLKVQDYTSFRDNHKSEIEGAYNRLYDKYLSRINYELAQYQGLRTELV